MSGGRPSRPWPAEGDHPFCTNKVRKDGETAGYARSTCGGLGLDGGRGRRPHKKEKQSALGWPNPRKGWKPHGRDYRLGSRQPGLKGARH